MHTALPAMEAAPLLSDAALANGRHIARFEAKPYPAPQAATAVSRAFEAGACPKL